MIGLPLLAEHVFGGIGAGSLEVASNWSALRRIPFPGTKVLLEVVVSNCWKQNVFFAFGEYLAAASNCPAAGRIAFYPGKSRGSLEVDVSNYWKIDVFFGRIRGSLEVVVSKSWKNSLWQGS